MNLAGDYTQACHDDIYARLGKLLGGMGRRSLSEYIWVVVKVLKAFIQLLM
mgnify:FL=1